MQSSHAELEQEHYRAVKTDPYYALQGLLEIRLEEMALAMPINQPLEDLDDRINNLEAISAEPGGIPRRYEDKLKQVQNELIYLRNKVNELTAKKPGRKSKYGGLKVES